MRSSNEKWKKVFGNFFVLIGMLGTQFLGTASSADPPALTLAFACVAAGEEAAPCGGEAAAQVRIGVLVKRVAEGCLEKWRPAALFSMPSNCFAAAATGCAGWAIPRLDGPVLESLLVVGVGPYEEYGRVTLGQTLREHWIFVLSILGLALVSMAFGVYAVRSRRRMVVSTNALRESEERFRAAFDSAQDCVLIWDKGYNYLYANQAAIDYVGTTADKVTGKNMREALGHVPAFMRLWMSRIDMVFKTGERLRVQDKQAIQGCLYDTDSILSPIRDAEGNVISVCLVYRDITELRKAEERLRQSEERLELAMAVANDGMWDWDIRTDVVYFDSRYYTMAGYEPDEFPPEFAEWEKRVHPEDVGQAKAAIEAHVAGESGVFDIEFRFKRKTHEWMWIRGRGDVVARDESGEPVRMVGTHSDITGRKRAEERVKHLNRVLAAIRRVDQLITHEKDRTRLLDEVCGMLVKTRGFHNVWIVLMESGKPVEPFYYAGFDEDFAFMAERLRTNELPCCARTALESGEIQVKNDPPVQCADCPLAGKYGNRGGLSVRLEHKGQVFGLLNLCAALAHVSDLDEQGLLAEVADDIAFALWSIEQEEKRERAEMRLREQQEFNDTLINASPIFFVAIDGRGKTLMINETMQDALGYSAAEVYGCDYLTTFVPERERKSLSRVFRRLVEEHGNTQNENHIVAKDGREILVEWYGKPIINPEGTLDYFFGVGIDLTERKRAEGALRDSEKKYGAILETSSEGYWLLSPDKKTLEVNQSLCDMLGYKKEEIIGRPPTDFTDEENREIIERRIGQVSATIHRSYELILKTKAGEDVFVHCNATTLRDEFGEVKGSFALVTDITERKQAESRREKVEAQLRQAQKMEAVGQLAGGVAHDFNNLLQALLGYGEMALDDAGPDSPVRASVEEMLKVGHRATTLVRQLLAFSRRQVLDMKDVDLNDVSTDLTKMIRRVIGEHITLTFIAAPDLGICRADPGQIEQILMNLCVNARDAMPEGGTITIETNNAEFDEEYCQSHNWATAGRYVSLSVTDTGCGMDKATADQVFDPFFTTKELGQGTGLGLATVYGLVKQHEGLVHVYSEVGKGSVFRIYLPLIEGTAAAAGDKMETPVPGGSETILVAEDDGAVLRLAKVFLEHAGYTVLTASDGEEALRVFSEHAEAIDMALLDVMMPKLGGRGVYEHIREGRPKLRFLFASGYSMDAIHNDFILDAGLTLIQKPYQRDELLRRVRRVLDRSD